MRFLLGLVLGAVVVVAVAEGLAGGHDWRARLGTVADYLQSLVAGGETIEPAAREPDPGAAPAPRAATSDSLVAMAPAPEPATLPIPRPPDPQTPESEAESGPVQVPEQPGGENVKDSVARVFGDEPPGATSARLPAPADPGPALQPVWVPFHSEMSANGFAERLTESLDHPFRVERRGPGSYQVVFAYSDEPARLTLLDRAAAATGLPL